MKNFFKFAILIIVSAGFALVALASCVSRADLKKLPESLDPPAIGNFSQKEIDKLNETRFKPE